MHQPDRVEYNITSGSVQISMEDGSLLPAYWAQPDIATKVPGVALIHDWWGVNSVVRHLAHLFAQAGHYVIVPDMFDGRTATTPEGALKLLDRLGSSGYEIVDTALGVLERHHRCNANVAAVGLGMGGSLAFEAAIVRSDLEACVAYAGFPQRYLGHFNRSNTPILALYGTEDTYVQREVIEKLRRELAGAPLKKHEFVMLEHAAHDVFSDDFPEAQHPTSALAWQKTLDFLMRFLGSPAHPAVQKKT